MGDGDLRAFAFFVRPGALDQQRYACVGPGDVLDVKPDEFLAAQRAGEADQEQGTVAGAGEGGPARSAQLPDVRRGKGGQTPGRGHVQASDAAERFADCRVLGVERLARHAAGASNGGDPATQRRHRVAFADGGQIRSTRPVTGESDRFAPVNPIVPMPVVRRALAHAEALDNRPGAGTVSAAGSR
jgi:hypothetical protein